MRLIGLVMIGVAAALAGCGALSPRAARSYGPTDFGANPNILHDGTTPREQLTLRGVKLGDPKSAIGANRIENEKDGWIVCRDRCKYRVEDGVVTVLGLWDPQALSKLRISSPADIEARFGKPEKTEEFAPLVFHRYAQGHIMIIWNKFENQVNAINVSG